MGSKPVTIQLKTKYRFADSYTLIRHRIGYLEPAQLSKNRQADENLWS